MSFLLLLSLKKKRARDVEIEEMDATHKQKLLCHPIFFLLFDVVLY